MFASCSTVQQILVASFHSIAGCSILTYLNLLQVATQVVHSPSLWTPTPFLEECAFLSIWLNSNTPSISPTYFTTTVLHLISTCNYTIHTICTGFDHLIMFLIWTEHCSSTKSRAQRNHKANWQLHITDVMHAQNMPIVSLKGNRQQHDFISTDMQWNLDNCRWSLL